MNEIELANTLRYFFSAVFQGFAALIALGAMSFIYFVQRTHQRAEYRKSPEGNMGKHTESDRMLEEDKEKLIRMDVIELFNYSILIMISSLISLFLVGYNSLLNYFLICVGVGIIFLSIKFLLLLKKTISETLEIRELGKQD